MRFAKSMRSSEGGLGRQPPAELWQVMKSARILSISLTLCPEYQNGGFRYTPCALQNTGTPSYLYSSLLYVVAELSFLPFVPSCPWP